MASRVDGFGVWAYIDLPYAQLLVFHHILTSTLEGMHYGHNNSFPIKLPKTFIWYIPIYIIVIINCVSGRHAISASIMGMLFQGDRTEKVGVIDSEYVDMLPTLKAGTLSS
ncbi:hypothetical protein ACJX0J_024389 [Zea mays]